MRSPDNLKLLFPPKQYFLKNYFSNPRFNTDRALIFLAGPIPGGGGWQAQACQILHEKKIPGLVVATPSKLGYPLDNWEIQTTEPNFPTQIDWEEFYMETAAIEGCLVFWLPKESPEEPRADGRPYAMMSRDELGSWRMRLRTNPSLKVAIGAEEGFPGKPELTFLFQKHLGKQFPIHHTLEETLEAAINQIT